jgi:hypothetical protein
MHSLGMHAHACNQIRQAVLVKTLHWHWRAGFGDFEIAGGGEK